MLLSIKIREMKSECGFSLAMASQPFPSEIFGCRENERQSSEILSDIASIALTL